MTSGACGAVLKAQFSVLFAYVCVCVCVFLFFVGGGGGWLAILKEVAVGKNFYLTPLPPFSLFFFFRPYPQFSL